MCTPLCSAVDQFFTASMYNLRYSLNVRLSCSVAYFSKLLIKIILFVHLLSIGNFFSNGLHVPIAKKAQKIVCNNVSINLHSLGT